MIQSHDNDVLQPVRARLLAFLFAAGLLVRLLYLGWLSRGPGVDQFSDFLYLHQLAISLSSGHGFTLDGIRIFNQSVGYPAFLSLFYWLCGPSVWTALVVNALLGASSVLLIYLLARRLYNRHGIALFSAGLAAIFPDSLLHCGLVSAENLLIPLLVGVLLVAVSSWGSCVKTGVATGLLMAGALTVKAHAVFLCPFILWIWWQYSSAGRMQAAKSVVRRAVIAAVTGLVALSPWTAINFQATGGLFVPFAAVAGEVMLDGTNPQAKGRPTNAYHLSAEEELNVHPVLLDRLRMKKAFSHIAADPVWYARLTLRKALLAFSPARDFLFEYEARPRLFGVAVSRWGVTVFSALSILALCFGLFQPPGRRCVALALFGAMLVVQMIFCAYPRYRYPFLFCATPFTAVFVLECGRAIRRLSGVRKHGEA